MRIKWVRPHWRLPYREALGGTRSLEEVERQLDFEALEMQVFFPGKSQSPELLCLISSIMVSTSESVMVTNSDLLFFEMDASI